MEVVKQQKSLNRALIAIKRGGVIICPTDTVYGFLADASDKKAVSKIYKIKKREKSKPLPVFVKDIKMAVSLAEIDTKQKKILNKYWPGKYTFIFKRKNKLKLYDGAKKTIAVRIPKYKFLNNLLKGINRPLVQTSVNISGGISLSKIDDILNEFGKDKNINLIIDAGNLQKNKPSVIIDLTKEKIKIVRK
jgi:L-threonylcarbamoyladenylate synthase